jgi:HSP20 family protein
MATARPGELNGKELSMMFRPLSPRRALDQLRGEMNRLVNGFTDQLPNMPWPISGRALPAANVWERDDAILVEMEIPGVKQEHLDLTVVENELTVKVERPELEEGKATFHRRERPTGGFVRTLRLPSAVDASQVEAELRNGVLTITLPKALSAKPRKIQVSAK